MLETEYLSRQNKLVSEVTRKLNYRVSDYISWEFFCFFSEIELVLKTWI